MACEYERQTRIGCAVFSHPNILRVHPPHLETVIHPAGDDPRPVKVKVGAKNFVSMSLDASKNCNIVLSLNKPSI